MVEKFTFGPPTENLFKERYRLRAVTPCLVMAGEADKQLSVEISRKRADGSNKVPRRSPAARRLPFDFIPHRQVLAAVGGDRGRDRLHRCVS